jgi:Mg/Co/Ni transporter MgtE
VTAFRPDTTAREALTRIRALKNKDIRDVFLVDDGGQLRAAVGIQDLALADPGARLDES